MRGMKQKMNEEILIKYIETTSKCIILVQYVFQEQEIVTLI